MARKKAKTSEPRGSESRAKVTAVALKGAALLYTFDAKHPAWALAGDELHEKVVPGALYRLRTPAGGEARAREIKKALLAGGAEAVRVEPAPAEVHVPERAGARPAGAEERGVREVCMELARETNAADREAVVAIVEKALSEVGL